MRVTKAFALTATALLLSTAAVAQAQQGTPTMRDTQPMAPNASGSVTERSTASLDAMGPLHEVKSDNAMATSLNVNAEELEGMDIYGADRKKIGDVNKVLADSSNSIKAVTVDVGGFLGIGAKEVVIPIDRLNKGTEKDQLQTSMTKAQIETLDEWQEPQRNMRGNSMTPASPTTPTTEPSR